MNKLKKTKQQFFSGELTKQVFIEKMFESHRTLHAYAECLASTNLAAITIRDNEVVAEFRDPSFAMYCPPGDTRIAPIEAFNFGDYEGEEFLIVRDIVRRLGGASARFFDIGANAGFYSLALSASFPGIKGVAFEPVPNTFQYLSKNIALNSLTGVVPLNLGLSNKKEEALFFTYPSQSGASSMTNNVETADIMEVRCSVIRLDDYCQANKDRADFIKCDVEGAELFVFQGAESYLVTDTPVVFTEMLRKWCAKYGYHPNDIIDFFGRLGFVCYIPKKKGLVRCNIVTDDTKETNFLFLHQTKHKQIISEMTE
jgi:FkbM family methyltransferase